MKRFFPTILALCFLSPAFAGDDSSAVSPWGMKRYGYRGLQPRSPDPRNLIGLWKNIGGLDHGRQLPAESLMSDFEFRPSRDLGTEVDIIVYQGQRSGVIRNAWFESRSYGSPVFENRLTGVTFNDDPPCTPVGKKCPIVFSRMSFDYDGARFFTDDKQDRIRFSIKNCTSIGDVYLVCQTRTGDDLPDDVYEVFARQLPPQPEIR